MVFKFVSAILQLERTAPHHHPEITPILEKKQYQHFWAAKKSTVQIM
jgi:hypothetical protein